MTVALALFVTTDGVPGAATYRSMMTDELALVSVSLPRDWTS